MSRHAVDSGRPDMRYHRSRQVPDRLNNSTRRIYDMLRSMLASDGGRVSLVEHELVVGLSASRSTVRAVLRRLAEEGLVTRSPRRGTWSTSSLVMPVNRLGPIMMVAGTSWVDVEGETLDSQLLGCPTMILERLRLPEGWDVLMVENLLIHDDEPLGLSASYFAVTDAHASRIQPDLPVTVILEQQLGVRAARCQTTILASAADGQTAGLLGVEPGAPMIMIEDLIEDDEGQPRVITHARLRSDRVAFTARAERST